MDTIAVEYSLLARIGFAALTAFIMFNYGVLLMGSMARIRARVQGRFGIPVWQMYIDILKNKGYTVWCVQPA